MKRLGILACAVVLLGVTASWGQTTTPPPQPPADLSRSAPAPGEPGGGPAPGSTTPQDRAPGAVATPGQPAAERTAGGIGALGWFVVGLVVLGIVVLLIVGLGRRERLAAPDRRDLDVDLGEPTSESEIEQQRRRRAS